jgi:UDP-2-acetamido-3-amino-2,3-dideoxy-glucuronate N-acetyltransferase
MKTEKEQDTKANYFIHESSYVDDNVFLGNGTKIWHFCHISHGAHIGENCQLGQNVYIGYDVQIGNGCKIQNNVSVYDEVYLEDYVFCGPSCVFTNDLTPRAKYPKGRENHIKTLVKKGASIGANATIVCGNTIGEWAMIGSGAVVTKNIPNHALMIGVPTIQKGWVCECGNILDPKYHCHHCGKNYKQSIYGLQIN